jgi:hypothetical protein
MSHKRRHVGAGCSPQLLREAPPLAGVLPAPSWTYQTRHAIKEGRDRSERIAADPYTRRRAELTQFAAG